jgi:hypothetical protein
MGKSVGLFDSFENIDQLTVEGISRWLKLNKSSVYLKNYLANKILYPQAVSISSEDMKIDLAILREILSLNYQDSKVGANPMSGNNPFINFTLRKILIPEKFLKFTPDLISLAWAFVDGLLLNRKKEDYFSDIWTVILTSDIDEIVGSVLLPQFSGREGQLKIDLYSRQYQIKAGSLTVVPCPSQKCQLEFKFNQGWILGKDEIAIEVYGGRMGLMIDGRLK